MNTEAKKPRIALIGPTLPYRSGIAQYTSQLHRALDKYADVQVASFSQQYPGWLYPNGEDYKLTPPQPREPGVRYSINVYNPLTWRKAVDDIAKNGCDMVVLDWWTLFWQPGLAYMARRLKKHGVKTVYLCHNLFDHKTNGLAGLISNLTTKASIWMLRQADAYVVQSHEKEAQLLAIKPSAEVLFRLHPVYDRFPPASHHLPQRGDLELLFFGLLRPYKGFDILLEALSKLQDKAVYLTVAGKPWGDAEALKKQIEKANVPNVELHLEHVSDEEAADYFTRADVVVTPYRSATGSGVVAVAYHYGKPVLATSVGGLKDVVIPDKTGWLVEPNSSDALLQAIKGLTRSEAQQMERDIKEFCQENSWDNMAQAICELSLKRLQLISARVRE